MSEQPAPATDWQPRLAREEDISALEALIPVSVRALQAAHYSEAQMQAALGPVFGVDRQLIRDGTYFVVEHDGEIVGCGGWSKRRSLYGGDRARTEPDPELDPKRDPARVRAFFVHPNWARRGIGRSIMAACERAIIAAGFRKVDIVATLAGEPLYASFAYVVIDRYDISMPGGLKLPAVRMTKTLCHLPGTPFPLIMAAACLALLCSCAHPIDRWYAGASIPLVLPPEVSFTNVNGQAGYGGNLFITLHLGDGEELLFSIDTGAQVTILDQSLQPKLGKRVGKVETFFPYYDRRGPGGRYRAPKLYLGNTQLLTGRWVATDDLSALTQGRPIVKGILGMDCLRHYCIQLDLARGRMRFLDPDSPQSESLGKAFPLVLSLGQPLVPGNFFGLNHDAALIDTGDPDDGATTSNVLHRAVQDQKAFWTNIVHMSREVNLLCLPAGPYGRENHSNLLFHTHFQNAIGLRFLARHLVTLNFPKRTMYLQRRAQPKHDAARVRAFFVHPNWARRGIGRSIMTRQATCNTKS